MQNLSLQQLGGGVFNILLGAVEKPIKANTYFSHLNPKVCVGAQTFHYNAMIPHKYELSAGGVTR